MAFDEPAAAEFARTGLRAVARAAITGPGRRLIVRRRDAALSLEDAEHEAEGRGGVIDISLDELTLGAQPEGYAAVLFDLLPSLLSAEEAAGGGLSPAEASWMAALTVGELAWVISECVGARPPCHMLYSVIFN